jgi:hypothetical protein
MTKGESEEKCFREVLGESVTLTKNGKVISVKTKELFKEYKEKLEWQLNLLKVENKTPPQN